MEEFRKFCNKLSPLSEEAWKDIINSFELRQYKRGDILLKEGQICSNLYFMSKGLAKIFFFKEDKQVVQNFFREDFTFTNLESYLLQIPSKSTIQLLKNAEIIVFSHNEVERLCSSHHSIETLMRKIISQASLEIISRVNSQLFNDGTERYQQFIEQFKDVCNDIPLGDVASYLGIAQVSLSRIRTNKAIF